MRFGNLFSPGIPLLEIPSESKLFVPQIVSAQILPKEQDAEATKTTNDS